MSRRCPADWRFTGDHAPLARDYIISGSVTYSIFNNSIPLRMSMNVLIHPVVVDIVKSKLNTGTYIANSNIASITYGFQQTE